MSDWLIESVRQTFFVDTLAGDEGGYWAKVAGTEPAQRMQNTKIRASVETSELDDGLLTVQVSPRRLDAMSTLTPTDSPEFTGFTDWKAIGARVRRIAEKLGGDLGERTSRVALGLVMHVPVRSRKDSYKHLATLLGGKVHVDEESEDFLYQINRPRTLEVDGVKLRLNRLSRWSTAMRLTVLGTSAPRYATRLELDLSTDAARTDALGAGACVSVFDATLSVADEIMNKGDVP